LGAAGGVGLGLAGLPFGGQGVEAPDEFFQLANGRAAAPGEHGVLAGVFGDGGDQQMDDRGERLAEGGGRDVLHG
jgi:hypothetical protein